MDEEVLAGGNAGEQGQLDESAGSADLDPNPGLPVGGSLGVRWGADNDTLGDTVGDTFGRKVNFVTATGAGTLLTQSDTPTGADIGLGTLTSDSVELAYKIIQTTNAAGEWDGGYQLIAYKSTGAFDNAADQVFTVTLDATSTNGSYEFQLLGNLDHPLPPSGTASQENDIDLTFRFRATDSDGDVGSAATFTVTVDDDAPLQVQDSVATKIVDEDDLADFNPFYIQGVPVLGLLQGSLGTSPNDGTAPDQSITGLLGTVPVWGDLSPLVNAGADSALASFHLVSETQAEALLAGLGLKSHGDNIDTAQFVNIPGVGEILGFFASDGRLVAGLFVGDEGTYNFRLFDQIDHPVGDDPGTPGFESVQDVLRIDLSAFVQYSDGDGDTLTLKPDSFSVDVRDDAPIATGSETGSLNENDLANFNPLYFQGVPGFDILQGSLGTSPFDGFTDGSVTGLLGTVPVYGFLTDNIVGGADEFGKFDLLSNDLTGAVLQSLGLKSHGDAINHTQSIDIPSLGEAMGFFASDGRLVFGLFVSEGGFYNFRLFDQLDHAAPTQPSSPSQGPVADVNNVTIDLSKFVTYTDFDGDTIDLGTITFAMTIVDDIPVLTGQSVNVSLDEDDLNNFLPGWDLIPAAIKAAFPIEGSMGTSPDADTDAILLNSTGKQGFLNEIIGTNVVNGGADEFGQFGLVTVARADYLLTNDLAGWTSKGEAIDHVQTLDLGLLGDVMGFFAGDRLVFTLTINPTGFYDIRLWDQVDHLGAGNGDQINLDLSKFVTYTDRDGDMIDLGAGNLVLSVVDDVSEAVVGAVVIGTTEDEQNDLLITGLQGGDLTHGNEDTGGIGGTDADTDGNPISLGSLLTSNITIGSLAPLVNVGADENGTFAVNTTIENTQVVDVNGNPIRSHGALVKYHFVSGTQLIGFVDSNNDGVFSASDRKIFTLTLSEIPPAGLLDGKVNDTFTFTQFDQIDHDAPSEVAPSTEDTKFIDLSPTIKFTDADGDTLSLAPDSFQVRVIDDTPIQRTGQTVKGISEEEHNVSGNSALNHGNEDLTPDPADGDFNLILNFNDVTTNRVSGNLSTLFSVGNDEVAQTFLGPLVIANHGNFALDSDATGLTAQGLMSRGEVVTYVVTDTDNDGRGDLLTATAGGRPVFTLSLDNTGTDSGSYTFTLLDQLDHSGTGEDIRNIDFSPIIRFSDFDGDTIGLTAGSFTIDVIDDTPIFSGNPAGSSIDEEVLTGGNVGEQGNVTNGGNADLSGTPSTTTGKVNLNISWGADNNKMGDTATDSFGRKINFAKSNGDLINDGPVTAADLGLGALTSDGVALAYQIVKTIGVAGVWDGGYQLIAYKAGGNFNTAGDQVFTVTLDATANTGAYTFNILNNLDHAFPSPNTGSENNLDLTFRVRPTDADGDMTTDSRTFTVTVDDDAPSQTAPTGTSIDEESLTGGNEDEQGTGTGVNADLPGALTTTSGAISLNISWGADSDKLGETATDTVIGRSVGFASASGSATTAAILLGGVTAAQIGLPAGLSSDGVVLNFTIVKTIGAAGVWDGGYQLIAHKGADSTIAANLVFTVTLDATSTNGSYTFNLLGNLDHTAPSPAGTSGENNLDLTFRVRATDADGDTGAAQTFTVTVDDDALAFGTIQNATIDEESVPGIGGNAGGGNGDLDPNPGTDVAGPPASRQVTGTFGILWGSDDANTNLDGGFSAVVNGDRSLVFASDAVSTLQGLNLTSDGVALAYTLSNNGTLLTATKVTGGATVFTIALSDQLTGSYDFKLFGNLDHASETAPGTENDTVLTVKVTARDGDGDATNAQFTVTVDDDAPTVTAANIQNGSVDDEGLSGNAGEPSSPVSYVGSDLAGTATTASGNLGVSWGADDSNSGAANRSLAFRGVTNGSNVLDSTGAAVTSHGLNVKYFVTDVAGVPTLIGYTGSDPNVAANQVFRITLDDSTATGGYNFQLLRPLDHPAANTEDDRTLNFNFTAKDADGDTADGSFSVTVDDDSPIINAVAVQNGFIDEERLPGGNAGGDGSDLGSPQDDGNATTTGTLGISYGADGLADVVGSAPTNTTVNFDNVPQGSTPAVTVGTYTFTTNQGIANHLGNAGQLYGTNINLTNSAGPFTVGMLGLGLFGTSLTGDGQVRLTGTPAAGGAPIVVVLSGIVTAGLGTPVSSIDLSSTALAGVQLSALKIEPVLPGPTTFNGSVVVDNVALGSGGGGISDGPVTFTDQSVASNNVSITDQNGNPINLASLTSDGQAVQFKLLDALTLVAYTGSAPTSIDDANVVFSAVLSGTGSGSYTFVQKNNLDHPTETAPGTENDLVIRLNYTAKDFDGDRQNGSFTVTIDDDVPVATATVIQGAGVAVYENELSTATGDVSTGTQAGNADNKNVTPNTDDTIVSGSLTSLVSFGADNALATFVVESTNLSSSLTSLTSNEVPLTYTVSGNTLTAKAGNVDIFTFAVDAATGNYTFTLKGQLDHFGASGAALVLDLSSAVTAVDGDGDSVSLNNQLLITVNDDVPVLAGTPTDGAVNEAGLPLIANAMDVKPLLINFGADRAADHLTFARDANGDPLHPVGITSDDVPLQYAIRIGGSGEEQLVAFKQGESVDQPVFIVELTTPPNPNYVFTLHQNLDHFGPNDTSLALGFSIVATDRDGDSVTRNVTVNVADDVVTVGAAPALGTVDEDARIASSENIVTTTGNFTFDYGNDEAAALTINPAVSLAGVGGDGQLRSSGQLVSYGFVGSTLVGYTGSLPGSATDGNVVFSVDLSTTGTGSYTFTLRQPLDHSGSPAGTPITMTFSVTGSDGDGDTAPTSFAIQIDPAGSISSIDYSDLTTGVIVNLADASTTVGVQTVAANTATDSDNDTATVDIIGNDNVAGIVDALGGSGDDILVGGAEANTLTGNGGKDVLDGGTGSDMLQGDAGDDTFVLHEDVEFTGTRQIQLGDGTQRDVSLTNMAGTGDITLGGADFDTINLDRGTRSGYIHDTLNAPSFLDSIEKIVGTDGGDFIAVNANYSSGAANGGINLEGGAGNDYLGGGAGADLINGGADNDLISGLGGDDTLNGDAGNDEVWGGAGVDTVHGGADNDTIRGNAGNDLLFGDGGDDLSIWNVNDGNDTFDGGQGQDTLRVTSTQSVNMQIVGNAASFSVNLVGGGQTTSATNVEVVELAMNHNFSSEYEAFAGAEPNVKILAHGTAADGTQLGLSQGQDTFRAGATFVTDEVDARDGNDNLVYTNVSNATGGGNVTINLDDVVHTVGSTTLNANEATWATAAAPGTVHTDLFYSFERAEGGGGNDTFAGNELANTFYGYEGNDTFAGFGGDDTVSGGEGSDTIFYAVGDGSDVIDGGSTGSDLDRAVINGNGDKQIVTISASDNDADPSNGVQDPIVIQIDETGNGSADATVSLTEVEDIEINLGGGADEVIVNGQSFAGTGLAVSTITIDEGEGDDSLNLGALTLSNHRVVADGGAGTDTVTFGFAYPGVANVTAVGSDGVQLTFNTPQGPVTHTLSRYESFVFTDGTRTYEQLFNSPPDTQAGSGSGNEDTLIAVTLNGSDVDGNLAGFVIKSLPANGTLYLNADGTGPIADEQFVAGSSPLTVYFKPNANWSGGTSFDYAARDAFGEVDATPSSASVTVTAVADAPLIDVGAGGGADTPTPLTGDIAIGSGQYATAAALTTGGFVTAWEDERTVYAQRYNADGSTAGSVISVSTTAGNDRFSSVTTLPGGGFAVVWEGVGASGSGVYARFFDGTGAGGTELFIGSGVLAAIDASDTNVFMAWKSGSTILSQKFDLAGNPVSAAVTTSGSSADSPEIAVLKDGKYVVTWLDYSGADGGASGVLSRLYDANGVAIGGPRIVPVTTAGGQFYSTVAALEGGGYAVTWTDFSNVRVRVFDANGMATTGDIVLGATGNGFNSITGTPDGGFIVNWNAPANGGDVLAQRFDASGNLIGQFTINELTAGTQTIDPHYPGAPTLAVLTDGSLVATWNYDSSTWFRKFLVPTGASGNEDTQITLPSLAAALADTDGSEALSVTISGAPIGSILTDGTNIINITSTAAVVVTGWTLSSLTVTPPLNYNGDFTLTVTATATEASNGDTETTVKTINVHVNPVNDAPVAVDDLLATSEDAQITFTAAMLLGNDSDVESRSLTITSVGGALNGTVELIDGAIIFTPAANFSGVAQFDYVVSDGQGGTDTGRARINVAPVADAPNFMLGAGFGTTAVTTVVNEQDGQNSSLNLFSTVVRFDNGNSLVVWNSNDNVTKNLQLFNAAGMAFTGNLLANAEDLHAIAKTAAGSYVYAYTSVPVQQWGTQVRVAHIDQDGENFFEVQLGINRFNARVDSASSNSAGDLAIVFTASDVVGNTFVPQSYVAIYDAQIGGVRHELPLIGQLHSLETLANGDFALITRTSDGIDIDLHFQVFDGEGNRIVNQPLTENSENDFLVDVFRNDSGDLALVFSSGMFNSVRIYDAQTRTLSNSVSLGFSFPAWEGLLPNGDYAAVIRTNDPDQDLHLKVVDAQGNVTDLAINAPNNVQDELVLPVSQNSDGDIAIFWRTDGQQFVQHLRVYDAQTRTMGADVTLGAPASLISFAQLENSNVAVITKATDSDTLTVQVFDGAGNAVFSRSLNAADNVHDQFHAFIKNGDGDFAVVRATYTDQFVFAGYHVHVYDAQSRTLSQDIALSGEDGFGVSWKTLQNGDFAFFTRKIVGDVDMRLQIINAQGSITGDLTINAPNNTNDGPQNVVQLADGDLAVVWTAANATTGAVEGLHVRVYDAQTHALQNEFTTTGIMPPMGGTISGYELKGVIELPSGGFYAVFAETVRVSASASYQVVFGQAFDKSGNAIGGIQHLETAPFASGHPNDSFAVQVLLAPADGGITVAISFKHFDTVVTTRDVVAFVQLSGSTSGNEDTAIALPLSASVTDTDSETLTLVVSDVPVGATLADGAGHTFTATDGNTSVDISEWTKASLTITPPSNSDVDFSLTVTATVTDTATYADGSVHTDTATSTRTIDVRVNAVNDAPATVEDTISVAEGGTATVLAGGATSVLANDTDVEGDTLNAVLVDQASNGTVTLNPDGTFSYVHNGGETLTDSFTYRANDGTADGNLVTVSITVTPVNDAPVALNDAYMTNEDNSLVIPAAFGLLSNDVDAEGDPLAIFDIITQPQHGTLLLGGDGAFTYIPHVNYNGTDSFSYRAHDGTADSNIATVNIFVNPINDAPVANSSSGIVIENGTLDVLAANGVIQDNDSDVDDAVTSLQVYGAAKNFGAITAGSNVGTAIVGDYGTLTLNADGSYTYVADSRADSVPAGSAIVDGFSYIISDPSGALSQQQSLNITVQGVNDAPVIAGLVDMSIAENAAGVLIDTFTVSDVDTASGLGFRVLGAGNVVDSRFEVVAASGTTFGQAGTYELRLMAGQSFDYEAENADTNPTIALNVEVNDQQTANNIAIAPITVTVTDVVENYPPVANTDTFFLLGNGSGEPFVEDGDRQYIGRPSDLIANDTDPDGDPLSVLSVQNGVNGTPLLFRGSIYFTPDPNFSGIATFEYTVSDGNGETATGLVRINVAPVADGPAVLSGFDIPGMANEFTVDQRTQSFQDTPVATRLADGRLLFTWRSRDPAVDGSDDGIAARVATIDADGNATFGNEFTVDFKVNSSQFSPNVITLADGRALFVWESRDFSYGSDSAVVGRVATIDVNGNATFGSEFRIEQRSVGYQNAPDVVQLADGRLLFTWTSQDPAVDSSNGGIAARVGTVDGSGNVTFASEFTVNSATLGTQTGPELVTIGSNRVVWTWTGNDGTQEGVMARVGAVQADGTVIFGAEFTVNVDTSGRQVHPQIVDLGGNRILIAYDVFEGNRSVARVGTVNADQSVTLAPEAQFTTFDGYGQILSDMIRLPDGRVLITWMNNSYPIGEATTPGDQLQYGVSARIVSIDGSGNLTFGAEFKVDARGDEGSFSPSAVLLADGRVVLTWMAVDADIDGDQGGISARVLTIPPAGHAEDTAIALPFTVSFFDPSETISAASLSGIPEGFTLTDGSHNAVSTGAAIDLAGWALGALVVTPSQNWNGAFTATLTVTGVDSAVFTDGSTHTDTKTTSSSVTVVVDPVNDAPAAPTDINNVANSVAENAANGTLVGITANATDIDGNTVTYSLTNNAGGRFAIDPSSGVVSVLNGALLDYETNTLHSITVQASDGVGGTSTQTFTIDVTDVAEGVTAVIDPASAGHYAFLNDALSPNAINFNVTSLFSGSGLAYTVTELYNSGSQNWSWFHANNSTTFSGNPDAASTPGLYVVEVDAKNAAGGATEFTAFSVLDGNGSRYEVTNNNASGAGGRAVTDDWRNNLVTLKAGVDISGDVSGGSNSDVVVGNEFGNRLFGSDGNDAIYGEGGNDYIDGGSNTDFLSGGAGKDKLFGIDGDDFLLGGSGDDELDGGSNRDTLVGGIGYDKLTGGSDTDRFVFSESGAANRDDILDFVSGTGNSADVIDISALLDQYSTGKSDHVRFLYSDVGGTTRLLSAAGNAPAIDGDVTIQVNTTGSTWESVATIKDTSTNLTTSNNVIQMMLDHATMQQFNA